MPPAKVLFACVQNAGRSQIAAAFFNRLADPAKAFAISAGTRPAAAIHGEVADVLGELGIELSGIRPQALTPEVARDSRMLITMGCGDQCPFVPGAETEDWKIDDPHGRTPAEVRRIRDEIRGRIVALLAAKGWLGATNPVLDFPP